MPWTMAEKVGDTKVSVLKDEYIEKIRNGGFYEYYGLSNLFSMFTNISTDYNDSVMTAGRIIPILKTSQGGELYFSIAGIVNYNQVRTYLYFKKPDGTIIDLIGNYFTFEYAPVYAGTILDKPHLPLYVACAFNEEEKKAAISPIFVLNYVKSAERYNAVIQTWNKSIISENELYNLLNDFREYDSDPWSGSGYAGIGGGEGTFDFKSDTIALPDLPTVDAVSSGFLQLFSGGLTSILELSKYMWSSSFFDSVVKITSNPIDIIMGLYMYPFNVPATNRKYVRAGNVITNVVMNVPDSQIIEIDCGSVEVPNFYGAYLDYDPFTKCDLFLPYCGTFPLSMDDIAGKTLTIKYRVDLLTGVCGAYAIIDESVKYNYTGTCAINIPISSRSFENVYNSIMGVVGSMIGGSSFGLPSVGSVAGAVTSGKNQIQHGGNCSGNAGYLGVQTPYLIFSVPNVAIPKGLNTYTGYPIFATYKLADLKGYTEVEEIHLENLGSATKEEIDMIINKLEEGVIL